jgi:hypothetical protein
MTAAVATRNAAGPVTMQGIAIPAARVDNALFRARTRRHTQQEKKIAYTLGTSSQDIIPLRKSDILSEITLHITGSLVLTTGGGTIASTAEWPYNLLKKVSFAANGASTLISARGWTLKAREFAKDEGLSDRGNTQTIGGSPRSNGTLSLACETWGVGSATSTLTTQTVPIDLVVTIPVAEDPFDLGGAIFLATSSAELSLVIDWANPADLFTLTGGATATLTGNLSVNTTKYDVPAEDGAIIVPDLSMFHSFIETSTPALAVGENEPIIVGQGPGKYVLRVIYQHYSAGAPLPMTAANFGLQAWRYGTSETPDQFIDGSKLRIAMERAYNTDLGGVLGFGVHEFAKAGLRDLVNMAETSDLRLVTQLVNAPTSPKLWYAVETMYRSGQAS